ncbi:hypothetical protein [Herminiimonas aquatilis]|uniref:Uncharacterized protein n=1 Tax=Herminiimonas aquatilis TaxID=345342 RepID=A0ABW2J5I3_9BURK
MHSPLATTDTITEISVRRKDAQSKQRLRLLILTFGTGIKLVRLCSPDYDLDFSFTRIASAWLGVAPLEYSLPT